ncbi:hypothetical protein DVK02_12360 [Halobellus sp. Atlit-31R]|nr:hypothetical protein DVK02_12360 [Halobellus sp. Atlit-31R]
MYTLTRRQILAAAAGTTLVAVGAGPARAATGLAPVELTQAAQIQPGEALPAIALDWRETVNGAVTADTDLTTVSTDRTGDVGLIVDEAVLPGDTGAVTLRATLVDGGETAVQSAELSLYFALIATAENGLTEPERETDSTPDVGELQDVATVEIWTDMGLGTGNGGIEDIPFVTDGDEVIASGTLATVAEDPTVTGGGYRLTRDGETCLSIGDEVYVSFRWAVPGDVGNAVQGDSARFAVGFATRGCAE